MRFSILKTFLCLLVFFVCPAICLGQQMTGSITGVVTDPNGAALPGAQVSATGSLTKETFQTTTDTQGRYTFSNLKPDLYAVEVKANNFLLASSEVSIKANEQAAAGFQLTLQPVAGSVTITDTLPADLERVPGSTASIPQREIEQSRANDLKDALGMTPGVLVQSRWGADESQISIRGSGLRSNFHLRGLNILINGLSYQDADGFSDFESLDLMTTQRMEVWKGANALRFGGNTMGGAINLVTETGETASPFQFRVEGGSYSFFKGQVSTGGVRGPFNYYFSFSDTELDGYREHSQQGRQRFYANMGWNLDDKTSIRMDVVYANVAEKLPGSLTRTELFENPRQADTNNVQQDWGRFYDYVRGGLSFRRQISNRQEFGLSVSAQYRNMDHPIFQVLDQDGRNFGLELYYRFNGSINGKQDRFVIGFSPQYGNTSERRYANVNGGRGNLVALFKTEAQNYGLYFENQLDLLSSLTLVIGGRADWAVRRFRDRFPADGDRSDRRTYSAFSPKVGVVWRLRENVQLFGNVSRSYEPPLLLELTSFGAPGFLDLEAQDTWQFEVGTRGSIGERFNWDVALYDAEIKNEIININIRPFPFAPFTIPSYRNARNTRHAGIEAGAGFLLGQSLMRENDRLTWRISYTLSQFRFNSDPLYDDNYIPGAPRFLTRSELRYEHPSGFWVAPNIDWSSATYFLDSANTVKNDKYAVLNLKAGYDWREFGLYFEAANLTNRRYSASVQVDSATGRFFEPSNGRSAYGSLRWRWGKKR